MTDKHFEGEDLETRVRQLEEALANLQSDSRFANLPYGTLKQSASMLSLRSIGGSGGAFPVGFLPLDTGIEGVQVVAATTEAAFQAAIDAAEAEGGGIVIAPRATYPITSGLVHDANVPLYILGFGAVLSLAANATGLKINRVAGNTATICTIQGLTVDGDDNAGTTGLEIEDSDRVTFRDVRVKDCAVGVLFDSESDWVEECALEGIFISSCTTGIKFVKQAGGTGSFGETHFDNVGIQGCATAIDIGNGCNLYRSSWKNVVIWFGTNQKGIFIDGYTKGAQWQIAFEGDDGATGNTAIDIGTNAYNTNLLDLMIDLTGDIATLVNDPHTKGLRWRQSGKDVYALNGMEGFVLKGSVPELLLLKQADGTSWLGFDSTNKWAQLINGAILRLFSGAYTGLTGQWEAGTGILKVGQIQEIEAGVGTIIEGIKALDYFAELTEIGTPAQPGANKLRLYTKDKAGVSRLYYRDDGGTEHEVATV